LAYLFVAALQPMLALGAAVNPRLARHFVHDLAAFRRLTSRTMVVAGALGLLGIAACALFGSRMLALFYAPEYAKHTDVLVWLAGSSQWARPRRARPLAILARAAGRYRPEGTTPDRRDHGVLGERQVDAARRNSTGVRRARPAGCHRGGCPAAEARAPDPPPPDSAERRARSPGRERGDPRPTTPRVSHLRLDSHTTRHRLFRHPLEGVPLRP